MKSIEKELKQFSGNLKTANRQKVTYILKCNNRNQKIKNEVTEMSKCNLCDISEHCWITWARKTESQGSNAH